MLNGKIDLLQMNINLDNFIYKISIEENLAIRNVLQAIRSSRLILFGRDLIGMIFTSILAEVKMIKSDDDFMTYLPERLTYNGGSMNICKKYIGCHNHFVTKL